MFFLLVLVYLFQGGYVFADDGLFVCSCLSAACLLATLLKSLLVNFNEMSREVRK